MSRRVDAAVVREVGAEFEIQDVELDTPRPTEVVVRMVAAGMCGTDLGVRAGHIPFPLPGVLGHEGAGIVEEVGSAVTSVKPGDKVLLSFTSCGTCRNCLLGHPAYCRDFLSLNLLGGHRSDGSHTLHSHSPHSQGEALNGHFFAQSSFSTYALADERGVTKVGSDADLSILAPLGCGIQTGAGAVFNILKPTPGTTLAVFGAGAVGLAAVMAAHLSGVERTFVIDPVASRRDLALELGATDVFDPTGIDITELLIDRTDGWGVENAIDATGSPRVLASVIPALAPLGTVAAIGAPAVGSTVDVDINFMLNGRRFIGITEGDSTPQAFLPGLISLVEQGRFPLEKLIRPYGFAEINDAAAALGSGAVLKPVLNFD